jgi:site-specific recombinase XerD
MTSPKPKRPFQIKNNIPTDPNVTPIARWLSANQGCYHAFRDWLKESSCSQCTVQAYAVGARFVLGYLNQPYWTIDPGADIDRVWAYFEEAYDDNPGKLSLYRKGFRKFRQYLSIKLNRPLKPKRVNWPHFLQGLPEDIAQAIRDFIRHSRRNWQPERQYEAACSLLSHLTHSLRWMAAHLDFESIADLTPQAWYAYVDARLAKSISPVTLNGELRQVWSFLRFAHELGLPVCERLHKVKPLPTGPRIPKDIPLEQLRILQAEIERRANSTHQGHRRLGLLDRAWFFLMLHCGLRSGEIRRLRLSDLDFEAKKARIEQSKGFKDRFVYFSEAVLESLEAYLAVRGPIDALPEQVFIFRHAPLSKSFCGQRLRTYAKACGVRVNPHQLRHTCATLLLNAGAPVLTVQAILGHQHIDTTMKYARLYDGTVAADYFKAMGQIEGSELAQPVEVTALLAALESGQLSQEQVLALEELRQRLLPLFRENYVP